MNDPVSANSNIINANRDEKAILSAVDKLPFECNIPTPDEIKPPMPSCINPNKAEAVPAFLENGASAIELHLDK